MAIMQEIKNKNRVIIIIVSVVLFLLVIIGLIVINRKNNLVGSIIQSVTNTGGKTVEISIDVSQITGEMPYIYRSGIWKQDNGQDYKYITEKFFRENVVGKVQLEAGGYDLASSKSFEDFKNKTNEKYAQGSNNRDIIERTKSSGQTLIIGQWPGKMPEWLSSRAGDTRKYTDNNNQISLFSPPKCYGYKCTSMSQITCYTDQCRKISQEQLAKDGYVAGLAEVIDYTLKYFKNDLGVKNLGYYYGHEQNKDWMGSEEEFYKTYAVIVKTIKAVDQNILVGGAGPWGAEAPRIKCGLPHYNEVGISICSNIPGWSMNGKYEPMNKNFVEYSRKNSLPIDFINWHSFALLPTLFKDQADTMRGWLKDNGFNENTPLFPADWTVWGNWYPADYIDTEYNPAYITNALFNMNKAGIQWQGADFDVGGARGADKGVNAIVSKRGKDAQFIGTWAIFTPEQIIKPVFNTFKLTSLLYGKQENQTSNQIQTNNVDDFLTIVSSQTQDKSKTRLLLSNFIPQGDILNVYITNKFNNLPSMLSTKDYRDQIKVCIEENGTTQAQIETCVKNILTTITDLIIKVRAQTQLELSICFKSSKDKIQCVNDAYAKTTDSQTKTDITTIKAEYEQILQYQKESRQVALNINNLPVSGQATITTYTIDKDHSNSCRYNKKTEPILKRTTTECGINGNVDKWVVQAKTESKTKAKPIAVAYLKQLGYTDTQLTNFNNQVIDTCLEQAKPLVCAQTKLATLCQNNTSLNCDKITQDIKDAYKKYQEAYSALFYYGQYQNQTISMWIDKINNDPNISLEGSKQTKQITITNGKYSGMLTMQPNSVVLMEIGR